MMYRALVTLWVAVCAALPALAAELEFSAGGEVEYDNNVFRTEQDTEDDVLFRLRPGVRIFEEHGDDLNFSAGYTAPIEFSIDNPSDLNEVDHIGDGTFNYHVNDQLEFYGSEHYGYVRSTLRNENDLSDSSSNALLVNNQRDRIKLNDASLGALYKFSPRTVGRLEAASNFFDSSREDRARVWSVGATGDLDYTLSLKHQVGAGLGYTFQDFGNRADIPGSQTNTVQLFGTWRWFIDPTLTFDLRAGPAYLTTQQDDADEFRTEFANPFVVVPATDLPGALDSSGNVLGSPAHPSTGVSANSLVLPLIQNCPVVNGVSVASGCGNRVVLDSISDAGLVGQVLNSTTAVSNFDASGASDQTITGFAQAVVTKHWLPTFYSALRYQREQGAASGLGGTVIADAVSFSNTWDFLERWSVSVRADYIHRKSAFSLDQTYDQVTGQPIPTGPNPFLLVATRNGVAFNSSSDVEIDTDRYGAAVLVTHLLFRTTSLYGQVRYDKQNSRSDSLGSDSDFENILATFGVRHVFEPITLW